LPEGAFHRRRPGLTRRLCKGPHVDGLRAVAKIKGVERTPAAKRVSRKLLMVPVTVTGCPLKRSELARSSLTESGAACANSAKPRRMSVAFIVSPRLPQRRPRRPLRRAPRRPFPRGARTTSGSHYLKSHYLTCSYSVLPVSAVGSRGVPAGPPVGIT